MEEADINQSKGSDASSLHLSGRSIRARPRVSYVEQYPDDPSDLTAGDESESDVYVSPATDEESEADIELISTEDENEDEASAISDSGSLDIMLDEESIAVEDDNPKPKLRRQHKTGESNRAGKGIDLSLPPLSSIQECMSDMTTKAVQLGLCEALESLGERPIRVATMCSGTESPLLALDEISKALVAIGHTPMQIQQEFSAEIEVFKQGYIERNFAPKRLFRDVRDFIRESATTAVTAYGAEVDIPTDVDIRIAGFVCKDLSKLNTRGKTLDDGGESGDTFQGMYAYTDRFRPSIVLLENVKNEKKTWDDVVRRFDKIGYEAQWIYCDTKNYYLPQTRERMYMVAIERTDFGKGVKSATSQWKDLMRNLERQCSSPYEAFLPDSLKESSGYSLLKNEPDWALCKLRNDHIRSEKRLGILSPISRRSDNGTVL
jgi:site-specific DNA-cytosine methylase